MKSGIGKLHRVGRLTLGVSVIILSLGFVYPSSAAVSSVAPSPALALAARLGVPGMPYVGDRANSIGGPWSIWLQATAHGPRGRALSVGPLGARGRFDYFDISAQPRARDPYHGRALPAARAIRLARAWLRHAGAPLPAGIPRVERSHTTIMGGTGLCCFTTLAVVHWGGQLEAPGIVYGGTTTIYVADAGRVVQADVGWLDKSTSGATCRDQTHRDRYGVPLGSSACLEYPALAGETMTMDIGGHMPWRGNPRSLAETFAYALKLAPNPDRFTFHVNRESASTAVYTIGGHGRKYRLTLIAAFPGLRGAAWQIAKVTRLSK